MSDTDHARLSSQLSFATYDDLSAADTAGLDDGALAIVLEAFGDIDAPDSNDNPYYRLAHSSVTAVSSPGVLATANSNAGALPGRWIAMTWSPTMAP